MGSIPGPIFQKVLPKFVKEINSDDDNFFDEMDYLLEQFENIDLIPGPILQKVLRLKAEVLSKEQNQDQLMILHLIESHIPTLRLRAEIQIDGNKYLKNSEEYALKKEFLSFSKLGSMSFKKDDVLVMHERIAEMPKEWMLVQITPHFCQEDVFAMKSNKLTTKGIYLTVFNCGVDSKEPYCINLPSDVNLTTREDVKLLKNSLKDVLSVSQKLTDKQKRLYVKKRLEMEENLHVILNDMENYWLGPWRCLLIGKYKSDEVEKNLRTLVDSFLSEQGIVNITQKIRSILLQGAKGYLGKDIKMRTDNYVTKILEYCFPGKKLKNAWKQFWEHNYLNLEDEERYPIILIIDETLDALPWETIPTLVEHPVSRLPSFHLLYAIYKTHEESIVNGYKIVSNFNNGKFILNPSLDLNKMETRLKTFFSYWLPEWDGIIGKAPTSEEFLSYLTSADVFCYSGHGSGTQYCSSTKISKKKIDAVTFLFGCGSTQLIQLSPQVEMYGVSQMYLLAACPCLIGMLWVVTDSDTDLFTTRLLSSWIPNSKKSSWNFVDHLKWLANGEVILGKGGLDKETREPDLLRALSDARSKMKFRCNAAAAIARGIPIKIIN